MIRNLELGTLRLLDMLLEEASISYTTYVSIFQTSSCKYYVVDVTHNIRNYSNFILYPNIVYFTSSPMNHGGCLQNYVQGLNSDVSPKEEPTITLFQRVFQCRETFHDNSTKEMIELIVPHSGAIIMSIRFLLMLVFDICFYVLAVFPSLIV